MNTARAGRKEQNGLIVWKSYNRELSETEILREIASLENEGLEFRKVINSDTIIVLISSDGQSFSKSHLRNVGVHWKRLQETHNQLNSIVAHIDHKKLEEWE